MTTEGYNYVIIEGTRQSIYYGGGEKVHWCKTLKEAREKVTQYQMFPYVIAKIIE